MSTPTFAPPAPVSGKALATSAETNELLATLGRDGFCVMKGVIPPDKVGAVRDSVQKSVRQHTDTPPPLGHVSGFLRVDQSYAPWLSEPRLMAVLERLFGAFFRISVLTGSVNGPGIKRGEVHADWPYNQNGNARFLSPYPDVMTNMVTMWMLTDYTIENGGTHVIPGSHKRDHSPRFGSDLDPMATYPGEVQLQGKAGDVGLFDARTWHAIAPNTTDQDRIGFIVRYAPWWLNLQPLRPGTLDRRQIVDAANGTDGRVEALPLSIYQNLPEGAKALVYHMVDQTC